MQKDYLKAVASVLNLMKQPDSVCKNISTHTTCYNELFKYLLNNNVPFSMETALDWLNLKKEQVSYESYTQYRNALLRLEHYQLFGDINSPFCRTEEDFFCKSGMSESFYRLTYELKNYFDVTQSHGYYHNYSVSIKTFFRQASLRGIKEPESICVDTLIAFWDYCQLEECPVCNLENAFGAMTALMKYLFQRGDVPACYSLVLFNSNAEKLRAMKINHQSDAFHPCTALEKRVDEFMEALNEWRYTEATKECYRNALNWYFLFLEFNRIEHSEQAIHWFANVLPEYPNTRENHNSPSLYRIHAVKLFRDFLRGPLITNVVNINRPNAFDLLPEWSGTILKDFMESRRRDGMTAKTIGMCQASSRNFFLYLEQMKIYECKEITPEVVVSFHNQDMHSTPESKNAYSIKLRQLLRFMAEQDLVPATLEYAVPTSYAPHGNIVDVLSNEMVECIFDFRKTASSPIELRDVAIVMLGLRMGIRGADILNLKLDNFDWKERTVSFVQKKTRTAITLPVPTDVGNSVYKYITQGRPQSAEEGNGYIFIHHLAPYVPLKVTTACRGALKRILDTYGYNLEKGQGFHMTRKTFATQLLRADNKLDDISTALGHARQETAEVYLERDEAGMRLCPLNFGGVLS